jgi:hypothetical protein
VGLAAPVPFHDLGFLVLGEHTLELDHQLVLRAVATGTLDELHPDPGAGEFLDQQRLAGELAGEAVRGVAQHHVQAALRGEVPQGFQAGPDQRRPGVTLVLEHPLRRDVKPVLLGVGAQRLGLGADCLVFLLPGAGHPGAGRRAGHGAAFLPGRPGSGLPLR